MKKSLKVTLLLSTAFIGISLALTGCTKQRTRVLIGSTTVTGDTYQNADLITRAISQEMEADMKVDPVGSGELFKELQKGKDDGTSVAFFHDYTYLGYLYGSYDKNWLEEFDVGPTVSINSGTCLAVMEENKFAIKDWQSLIDAAKVQRIVIGIQEGSVSNYISERLKLYLVEEKNVPAENIEFSPLGSMGDQREALWSGTIDVFNGTYSVEYENTKEAGNTDKNTMMNIIALTGEERLEGVDVPTLNELTGGKLFFEKEFFFVTKKGTDKGFINRLEKSVENAVNNDENYNEKLKENFFKANYKNQEQTERELKEKMEVARKVIEANK